MNRRLEYGWARKREQIHDKINKLITGLQVGEYLTWPDIKQQVRIAANLKPGFETNNIHSMLIYDARKLAVTGKYEIREDIDGVKYIIRIK